MVERLGIGAASASAVVFAVILACDVALFASSQSRAALYSQSNAADLFGDESRALVGAVSTNVLLEVQSFLSANPLACSTADRTAGSEIGSLVQAERSGPVTVTASPRQVAGVTLADNLSMLRPFNGSVLGDLDIGLRISADSARSLTGVGINRTESHFVHLPLRWDSEVADCLKAVRAIVGGVSSQTISNCTSGVVGPVISAAVSGPRSSATADGFLFGFGYAITDANPCTVAFQITVGETGVQGPGGSFSVSMEEEGTAVFA